MTDPRADEVAAGAALTMGSETFRRLAHRVVDRVADHLDGLDALPVARPSDAADVLAALAESPPRTPGDPVAVLERLERDVWPHVAHVQHPRFFAFVPGPGNPVGVLADTLTAGWNLFAGTWYAGAGPIAVERSVIDWLRTVCGLPASTGGLLVSGGSMANLTALAAARAARFGSHDMRRAHRAVVYTGDQTHSAVSRALRVLGFGDDQVVAAPTDARFRLDPSRVARALARDRAAGREPFAIVANAGTTNTGAVDPLDTLADLARDEELWLHVDGAYGAPARMTERGRALLHGLERADSIALDPHKWLFQPFEIGCVLLRDGRQLEHAFAVHPEYLRDVPRDHVNPADQGVQLTRSFRALKLWMTLQVFGTDQIEHAIEHGLDLAVRAEALLRQAGCWHITTAASLAIVTFRYRHDDLDDDTIDRLHTHVLDALRRDGTAAVTSTLLGGRSVLRLCTINPRTTEDDLRRTIDRLGELANDLAG